MKILCDTNNVIIAVGELIQFGLFEGIQKWKVSEHMFMMDDGYMMHEIDDQEIEPFKNCYTTTDGVFVNPNWVGPMNFEQEIEKLKAQNEELYEFTAELLMNQCSDELGINGEGVI